MKISKRRKRQKFLLLFRIWLLFNIPKLNNFVYFVFCVTTFRVKYCHSVPGKLGYIFLHKNLFPFDFRNKSLYIIPFQFIYNTKKILEMSFYTLLFFLPVHSFKGNSRGKPQLLIFAFFVVASELEILNTIYVQR